MAESKVAEILDRKNEIRQLTEEEMQVIEAWKGTKSYTALSKVLRRVELLLKDMNWQQYPFGEQAMYNHAKRVGRVEQSDYILVGIFKAIEEERRRRSEVEKLKKKGEVKA